jgi:copper chaperone CopZ
VNGTPTPAAAAHLLTENFEFTVPVSEDDMDPIIPSIRNLDGVTDVQAGGNGLQVTYDPSKVSHRQIVDTVSGYGFHVKE